MCIRDSNKKGYLLRSQELLAKSKAMLCGLGVSDEMRHNLFAKLEIRLMRVLYGKEADKDVEDGRADRKARRVGAMEEAVVACETFSIPAMF